MISKKPIFYIIISLLICGLIGVVLFKTNRYKTAVETRDSAKAASGQTSLTLQADWDVGAKANIDSSSSPGSIKINNLSSNKVDLSGKTTNASADVGSKELPIDGNEATYWTVFHAANNGTDYWQVDLGSQTSISLTRLKISGEHSAPSGCVFSLWGSNNGTDFTQYGTPKCVGPTHANNGWQEDATGASFRYYRVVVGSIIISSIDARLYEYELYQTGATGTHTSSAAQITDTNLYQWQTFTATYSKPANSDVSFKFRTSTDSSTWTAWTASQTPASGTPLTISSLVTSSTGPPGGETFYKYIQVETTLISTDGVANPTVSDYTVAFHTNVAPNKPTAQNATIGS